MISQHQQVNSTSRVQQIWNLGRSKNAVHLQDRFDLVVFDLNCVAEQSEAWERWAKLGTIRTQTAGDGNASQTQTNSLCYLLIYLHNNEWVMASRLWAKQASPHTHTHTPLNLSLFVHTRCRDQWLTALLGDIYPSWSGESQTGLSASPDRHHYWEFQSFCTSTREMTHLAVCLQHIGGSHVNWDDQRRAPKLWHSLLRILQLNSQLVQWTALQTTVQRRKPLRLQNISD